MLLDGVGTDAVSDLVAAALQDRGRIPLQVRARAFWRSAGERYAHGRQDWQSFRDGWLDVAALRREVLEAGHTWLPALRDVERDRSIHLPAQPVPAGGVLLVDGVFLQGLGLPAELVVHVALSPAALQRRGVPDWQLPAFASYDELVGPAEAADVLVRAEDPLRPAVRWPG